VFVSWHFICKRVSMFCPLWHDCVFSFFIQLYCCHLYSLYCIEFISAPIRVRFSERKICMRQNYNFWKICRFFHAITAMEQILTKERNVKYIGSANVHVIIWVWKFLCRFCCLGAKLGNLWFVCLWHFILFSFQSMMFLCRWI